VTLTRSRVSANRLRAANRAVPNFVSFKRGPLASGPFVCHRHRVFLPVPSIKAAKDAEAYAAGHLQHGIEIFDGTEFTEKASFTSSAAPMGDFPRSLKPCCCRQDPGPRPRLHGVARTSQQSTCLHPSPASKVRPTDRLCCASVSMRCSICLDTFRTMEVWYPANPLESTARTRFGGIPRRSTMRFTSGNVRL